MVIRGSVEPEGFFAPSEADPLRYYGNVEGPNEVATLVAAFVPRESRVLDVGCGTGLVARTIRDSCDAQVIGIEPSAERARVAEERGIPVIVSPFSSESLEGLGRFDAVVFADVLEHLVDPAAALDMALTCLAPGGVIVVSLPNVAHWTVRWHLLRGRFDYQPWGIMDATHLRWFTRDSASALFDRVGLRVRATTSTLLPEMPAYRTRWPLRWVPHRARLALLRRLLRRFPGLFAWQHVFQLRPHEL